MPQQDIPSTSTTMRRVEIAEFGGLDSLRLVDAPLPDVGPHEVLVRVRYAGVNFADIMQRVGRYPDMGELPYTPGMEVVGTVEAVGSEVDGLTDGTRVLARTHEGGYAQYATAPSIEVVPVPEEIDDAVALGLAGTHGLTAFGLVESLRAPDGRHVFVSAAAGGVGSVLVQLATAKGWPVVAGVSSAEKASVARSLSAAEVVRYDQPGWEAKLSEVVGEAGLGAAVDAAGGDVHRGAFAALGSHAELVFYGATSGDLVGLPPEAVFPAVVRCQAVRGFCLPGYAESAPDAIATAVEALFAAYLGGTLAPPQITEFALEDVAQAQDSLESRRSAGKIVLKVAN